MNHGARGGHGGKNACFPSFRCFAPSRFTQIPRQPSDLTGLSARFATPAAMDRVEVEQMRGSRAVAADLVNVRKLDFGGAPTCTECEPSHTSEAIDAKTCDAHGRRWRIVRR